MVRSSYHADQQAGHALAGAPVAAPVAGKLIA
jgi:hypothetical protein